MLVLRGYPQVVIANGTIKDSTGVTFLNGLGIVVTLRLRSEEMVPFNKGAYDSFLQEHGNTQMSLLESNQDFANNGSFVVVTNTSVSSFGPRVVHLTPDVVTQGIGSAAMYFENYEYVEVAHSTVHNVTSETVGSAFQNALGVTA